MASSLSINRKFETAAPDANFSNDLDQSKQNHLGVRMVDPNIQQNNNSPILRSHDQTFHVKFQQQRGTIPSVHVSNHRPQMPQVQHSLEVGAMAAQHGSAGKYGFGLAQRSNGGNADEGFNRDMRDLEELLSKLNPMAEEFVPPSLTNHGSGGGFYTNNFVMHNNTGNYSRRKKNDFSQGKRRMNSRTSMAQQEEIIRRTVYVSDIDLQVTEEQLAALFINCGQVTSISIADMLLLYLPIKAYDSEQVSSFPLKVVDCRVCGDPNSVLRFAFIEFTDEEGARAALSLEGTMLGYYPLRVLPSKTAIAPVNPTFLPRSEDEREMCARTIYCTNIDKKVSQADVKLFFESVCGEVYRLRLLGDYHHSTRIAFVEFVMVIASKSVYSHAEFFAPHFSTSCENGQHCENFPDICTT
ncbi:hypothetical protein HHK36_000013 [Tetracentron sinense]|uniref:RRM domain-containing protein n=1 Tax=Tetracentron sinense TaxID=13715 RepID=A0A834ZV85_TETSI|nr:hypothetical protein HHK36_000013 [Tetracentron sinense]